jgi:hyperosmotically inducible periplasmic protein
MRKSQSTMDLRNAMLIGVVSIAIGAFAVAGCEQREQGESNADARKADGASGPAGSTDRNTAETARLRGMGALFDDAAMTTKVKIALASSVGKSSTQISVDTRAAVVTLTGEVDTPDIRDRADQAVLGVDGVRSVVDNIVVKSPTTG